VRSCRLAPGDQHPRVGQHLGTVHEHLETIYQAWYDWAREVLPPALAASDASGRRAAALGQSASVLLDGLFLQMVIAAPGFDLESAMANARRSLLHVAAAEAAEGE
jgi:hypothetical protein